MDNSERIIALLENLNTNISKLTEAFNRHTNQVAYGPTKPPSFVEKKFEAVQSELAKSVNAMMDSTYAGIDIFAAFNLPSVEKMQVMAGIKPKRPELKPELRYGAYEYVKDLPKDLPDEMFEDALVATIRSVNARRPFDRPMHGSPEADDWDRRHALQYGLTWSGPMTYACAQEIYRLEGMEGLKKRAPVGWDAESYVQKYGSHWVAPSMPAIDPDEFDDDTPTDPMIKPVTDQLRAQRKKDGVCPECGDIKRESAVGICRDHGKFMG